MDFLNGEPHQFDWDNISVGCTHLDHSQNFFAKKHFEHERKDELELLQQKMTKTEISADKENISKCSAPVDARKVKNEGLSPTKVDKTNDLNVESKHFIKTPSGFIKKEQTNQDLESTTTANLAGEWSTKKPKIVSSKGAVTKSMPPPPHAYLVKDIYQRKREEAQLRRAEEERKMREFHSRPAPSFNNLPQKNFQKRKPVHAVTLPITPQVLKKSRDAEEKRRLKMEEWKQKHQLPKFEPRLPTVLKEKPFIPGKKATVLHQQPFTLQVEKRLQERKQYDEIRRKAMEERRKQEEEERERLEKERIRELRKATSFKARPNPFKN